MAKLTVCVFMLPLLLLLLLPSEGRSFCCTEYHKKPVPVRVLKYFTIQKDTDICNINAIIFVTLRGKPLCANPDRIWVQRAMEVVPHRKIRAA